MLMTDEEMRALADLVGAAGNESDRLALWLLQQVRSDVEKMKSAPSPITADTPQEGIRRVAEASHFAGRIEAFQAVMIKLREGGGS